MGINKRVSLRLIGLNGNAFSLMGAFKVQARKEGWTKEEVQSVLDECKSGDYDHLLATLAEHCTDPSSEHDETNDDEDYKVMLVVKKGNEIVVEESLIATDDFEEVESLAADISQTIRVKYGY